MTVNSDEYVCPLEKNELRYVYAENYTGIPCMPISDKCYMSEIPNYSWVQFIEHKQLPDNTVIFIVETINYERLMITASSITHLRKMHKRRKNKKY